MSNVHRYPSERRRNIAIIGVACGIGASDPGCGDGPGVLEATGIAQILRCDERDAIWKTTLSPEESSDAVAVVAECATRTASAVSAAMAAGDFPVVIGGDHSCAIGSWRGVAQTMAGQPLGMLWIDAHLDSHTPETSHSGALHGMPLACLLGVGPEKLTHGKAILHPQHVAVIGARSFEPEEHALLKDLGVRVFFMDEIIRRGLDDAMQEALTIVQCGTRGFGISLDLDAIDPKDAPGVSTPSPAGLSAPELVSALARLRNHPDLLALEIAEYDPYRDEDGKSVRVVMDLLSAVLGAENRPTESLMALMRMLPVSAFLASREVMRVFKPGDHGSTFGGNPLAAAVALEALNVIVDERLPERSAKLGRYLLSELRCMRSPLIRDVRGLGLFIGVEIDPAHASARQVFEHLMARGILSKDTHGTVVRFAPPLTITREELNWALRQIRHAFDDWAGNLRWVA